MRYERLKPKSLVSLVSMTLLAAAAPQPAVLAPYIHGSAFDAGDYGWMRGRFGAASADEKAAWQSVQDWLTRCMADEQARIGRELAAVGVVTSKLPPGPYQDAMCRDVASAQVNYDGWPSFSAFQADVETAEPIVGTFLWATSLASDIGGRTEANLAQQLLARPLGEQMLRFGSQWGNGRSASSAPKLSPGVRAIVTARIGMAIGRSDYHNTEYLKGVVVKQGWPTISAVGERAANAAWLLAQHADNDPLFQLSALRLMEPLAAAGEVSKKSYAYLYDRVMLKIAGAQRYATQMTCQAGKRIPLPLEDPKTVDRLRAEAGLSTLAEYQKQMTDLGGNCPP